MENILFNSALVAQLIGFVALLFALSVFQANKRGNMIKLHIVAATLYAIHFFMLGAFTGSIMNLLGGTRNFLFYKIKQRTWLLPGVFMLAYVIACMLTWEGLVSLLPMFGMIAGTLAFWQQEAKMVRYFALISFPLWFAYSYIVGSYPGMITEVILFTSNLIGMYRFDRHKIITK